MKKIIIQSILLITVLFSTFSAFGMNDFTKAMVVIELNKYDYAGVHNKLGVMYYNEKAEKTEGDAVNVIRSYQSTKCGNEFLLNAAYDAISQVQLLNELGSISLTIYKIKLEELKPVDFETYNNMTDELNNVLMDTIEYYKTLETSLKNITINCSK
ncbi:MAG: hypothetical protein V3U87_16150 [Methylococcaceae bacterium]